MGLGFGETPVTIEVRIDGAIVYSGPVPTSNTESILTEDNEQSVFEWPEDVNFHGWKSYEVTVTNDFEHGGYFELGDTRSNRGPATEFVNVVYVNRSDNQGYYITSDPFRNLCIDGIPQNYQVNRQISGQYVWRLLPQQTLTAEILIRPT